MSEKISMVRRLRLEANAMGEFQAYASRDYRRMLLDAADEMEQLRKERDEARRMWCEAEAVGNCLSVDDMYRRARAEAKRREWDCYKEDGK